MIDPVEQFRAAMTGAGLVPPRIILPDGRLHRFASNGEPRDKAGWYVLHLDGVPAGMFGDFRSDMSSTWRADIGRKLSPQEVADCKARAEADHCARKAADAKIKAEARKTAAKIWNAAAPAPDDHAYLVRKNVTPHGLRVHERRLVVPMRDDQGILHSLHFIAPDGGKQFLADGRIAGCFFQIGEPGDVICLAEGFATAATVHEITGHAAVAAINRTSLLAVAQSFRKKFPEARIVLCADDDWMREQEGKGNPGLTDARAAAEAAGGVVAVPEFGAGRGEKDTDFNDMARVAGRGAVLECFRKALDANGHDSTLPPGSEGTPERAQNGLDVVGRAKQDKEAFRRLSRLSRAEYDRVRAAEAEALGIRIATLDKGVEALRPGGGMAPGQGQVLVLPESDPWPEPVVDGAALLSELRNTIKKFLVCSPPKAAAIALWIAATWFEPAAQVAPILNIRSPLPRCGNTTLLDLIRRLSKRSLAASSITAAALFRTVEKCCPTLVIDEADSFFAENEEMRGVLNSGHTRQTAFVIRTVGEDHEPHQFSTWGFKTIAGIGKRAGTIEDRSIAIDLERKLRDERVSRLRHAPGGLFTTLQQKLCRWSSDNGPAIGDARPSLPEALNDRQQDNWEILVAIADLAGGEWPVLVHSAAVSLSNAKDDTEPLGGQLLDDIKDIVNGSSASGVYSRELLDKLVTMPERPWGECNHGKPLTQNRLAKMLGAFGLKTKDLRIGGVVQRGYDLAVLRAAFERYCPVTPVQRPESSFQSATVLPVNEINGLYETQSATIGVEVALQNKPNILKNKGCSTVALQNPQAGGESEIGGFDGQWRTEL